MADDRLAVRKGFKKRLIIPVVRLLLVVRETVIVFPQVISVPVEQIDLGHERLARVDQILLGDDIRAEFKLAADLHPVEPLVGEK